MPRDNPRFSGPQDLGGYSEYRYQYAFVILFPELEIGAGFKIKSLGQTGDTILSAHQSTVSMARDVLQNGNIASSILSIERNKTCLFMLYVGAREVNNSVETAVRLFPAETSLDMVEATKTTFRPPCFYWDECHPFSLVVSKGQHVDPLPGEHGTRTIFSVSLHVDQGAAELETEDVPKSESEEASASESEGITNAEGATEVESEDLTISESEETSDSESYLDWTAVWSGNL